MSFKACLFGHSFPARARAFRERGEDVNGVLKECDLSIVGYPGLTFERILRNPVGYVSPCIHENLDVCIIDVGTNDLCNESVTPSSLVDKAVSLIEMFKSMRIMPKCVVFLSVIQRTRIMRRGQVELRTFNHRVRRYNALLSTKMSALYGNVLVMPQSKINLPKYIADGCHLTDEGMKKYLRNVYSICLKVKKVSERGKL